MIKNIKHAGLRKLLKKIEKNPIHPGETIEDGLKALNLTFSTAAQKLEISEWTLFDLMQGKIPVTKDIAEKLEKELGSTSACWLRMQEQYDQCQAKQKKSFKRFFGLQQIAQTI